MVYRRRTVGKFRMKRVLRGWSHVMREELAVVEKMVRMIAWIHRERVVPNEGFLPWTWGWFVEIDGPLAGRRSGRTCGDPSY